MTLGSAHVCVTETWLCVYVNSNQAEATDNNKARRVSARQWRWGQDWGWGLGDEAYPYYIGDKHAW